MLEKASYRVGKEIVVAGWWGGRGEEWRAEASGAMNYLVQHCNGGYMASPLGLNPWNARHQERTLM